MLQRCTIEKKKTCTQACCFQCPSVERKGKKRRCRKLWVRPGRTSLWWFNMRAGVTKYEECSKCPKVRVVWWASPSYWKKATIMPSPVDVEKQVEILLFYLSDEGQLRKTVNAFGVFRSSVSIIVRRVTHYTYQCTLVHNIWNFQSQRRMFKRTREGDEVA